jgi:hypothetical protein
MEDIVRQIEECRKDDEFLDRLRRRHEIECPLYERLAAHLADVRQVDADVQ